MVGLWFHRLLSRRIVRYIIAGGIATLIHLAVAFSYLRWAADDTLIANLLGFSCAFIFSYLVQSLWVFEHPIHPRNALKFLLVQLSALASAQLISEQALGLNSYFRVILVILILPLITFIIHRLWTFALPQNSRKMPH